MLFDWDAQVAQRWREASAYTGYDRNLAALLLPLLAGCDTLCDIGCGLGLVDLELAPYFREITCVDISEDVLGQLRAQIAERGLKNIRTVCADGMGVPGQWDAVMALFHGEPEEIVPAYLQKATDRFLLVVHGSPYGTTGPKEYRIRKCCDTESTAAWLDANGYRYTLSTGELEFGQPHRSFEDAVAYTRTFSNGAPEEEIVRHVRETVTETGRSDYPLYTPKKRSFGVFLLRKDENER